jgi:hypothetical protein
MSTDDEKPPHVPPPDKPVPQDPTKPQTHGLEPSDGNTIHLDQKKGERR